MIIRYGRYRGRHTDWVVKQDPGYALWAHKNVWWFNLSPKQVEKAYHHYLDNASSIYDDIPF